MNFKGLTSWSIWICWTNPSINTLCNEIISVDTNQKVMGEKEWRKKLSNGVRRYDLLSSGLVCQNPTTLERLELRPKCYWTRVNLMVLFSVCLFFFLEDKLMIGHLSHLLSAHIWKGCNGIWREPKRLLLVYRIGVS